MAKPFFGVCLFGCFECLFSLFIILVNTFLANFLCQTNVNLLQSLFNKMQQIFGASFTSFLPLRSSLQWRNVVTAYHEQRLFVRRFIK